VLCRTAIGFDAAGWEIWLPLISGAAVCLTPTHLSQEPSEFSAYLDQHGVTIAQFVPSLLAVTSAIKAPHNLRRIFSGGEPLIASVAREALSRHAVPLVNLYGPTETTIQVTSWLLQEADLQQPTVPIGRP